jgi:hypothetical protein
LRAERECYHANQANLLQPQAPFSLLGVRVGSLPFRKLPAWIRR